MCTNNFFLRYKSIRKGGIRSPLRALQVMESITEDECDEDRYYQARTEWDMIETLPIINLCPGITNTTSSADCVQISFPSVTIEEINSFIDQLDLSDELTKIKPEIERKLTVKRFFKKLLFLSPPTLSSERIKSERNRIFALALKPFDDASKDGESDETRKEKEFQTRMLFTVYRILTKCPVIKAIKRMSSDWENIGFQGTDPSTDFRGVGLLGLYQLVHFVVSPDSVNLAMDTFALSLNKEQNFPFCVMSINVTSLILQLLRIGTFNRDINLKCKDQPFVNCFNRYHCLAFKIFYHDWKFNKRTIKDAGFVIVHVRKTLQKLARNRIAFLDSSLDANQDKEEINSDGDKKTRSWKALKQVWRMKLKGPNRFQKKGLNKTPDNDHRDDKEFEFTDINVIETVSDASDDDQDNLEYKTPEPGNQDAADDIEEIRPFTPYDDDSLDGASITRERRLI